MQIKVNLQIFIFAIIFYLTKQIEIYAILMFFAFIHEVGHLIAGICLKLKPKCLEITPFGLAITFREVNNMNRAKFLKKKLIVALAGPITNILIIILTILTNFNLFGISVDYIVYSNILIAVFNLLPIYPLDGGRIVRILLEMKFGSRRADLISYWISKLFVIIFIAISSVLILYYKNIAILLVVIYVIRISNCTK